MLLVPVLLLDIAAQPLSCALDCRERLPCCSRAWASRDRCCSWALAAKRGDSCEGDSGWWW